MECGGSLTHTGSSLLSVDAPSSTQGALHVSRRLSHEPSEFFTWRLCSFTCPESYLTHLGIYLWSMETLSRAQRIPIPPIPVSTFKH